MAKSYLGFFSGSSFAAAAAASCSEKGASEDVVASAAVGVGVGGRGLDEDEEVEEESAKLGAQSLGTSSRTVLYETWIGSGWTCRLTRGIKGGFWVEGCLARRGGRTAGRREAISQEGLRGYSCLKGCWLWCVVVVVVSWVLNR